MTDEAAPRDGEPSITTTTYVGKPAEISSEDADLISYPAVVGSTAQRITAEAERTPLTSVSYSIPRSVFGSGGGAKTSTHYVMNSTQGQSTDLARRTSASYVLLPGYWGTSSPRVFDNKIYLPVVLRNH